MSDPRTTPMKDGVAFTREGTPMSITRGRDALRHKPSLMAVQDNELLFGDGFTVLEFQGHQWAWGQTRSDGYVGYIDRGALAEPVETTHRVTALSTPWLWDADVKSVVRDLLPLNAQVKVLEPAGSSFVHIAPHGFVWAEHLAPLDRFAADWVATAERFLGSPYVWGGKTHHGIDCSGLVQVALASAGIKVPRDTDQQEALGTDVPFLKHKRGDLVFWNGHVGIMLDESCLLHANAFHMQVEIEPLDDAIARIAPIVGPVNAIKRL